MDGRTRFPPLGIFPDTCRCHTCWFLPTQRMFPGVSSWGPDVRQSINISAGCCRRSGLALPGESGASAPLFLLPLRWRTRRGVHRGVFARGTPRLSHEVTESLSPAHGAGDGAHGGFSEGASEPASGCAQTHRQLTCEALRSTLGRGTGAWSPKLLPPGVTASWDSSTHAAPRVFLPQGAQLRRPLGLQSRAQFLPAHAVTAATGHAAWLGPGALARCGRPRSAARQSANGRTLRLKKKGLCSSFAHIPILLLFFYSHLFFSFSEILFWAPGGLSWLGDRLQLRS